MGGVGKGRRPARQGRTAWGSLERRVRINRTAVRSGAYGSDRGLAGTRRRGQTSPVDRGHLDVARQPLHLVGHVNREGAGAVGADGEELPSLAERANGLGGRDDGERRQGSGG